MVGRQTHLMDDWAVFFQLTKTKIVVNEKVNFSLTKTKTKMKKYQKTKNKTKRINKNEN